MGSGCSASSPLTTRGCAGAARPAPKAAGALRAFWLPPTPSSAVLSPCNPRDGFNLPALIPGPPPLLATRPPLELGACAWGSLCFAGSSLASSFPSKPPARCSPFCRAASAAVCGETGTSEPWLCREEFVLWLCLGRQEKAAVWLCDLVTEGLCLAVQR